MGRRLTRKQIKKDEIRSAFDRIFHWFGANWKQATIGIGCALGVALLWWVVVLVLGNRTSGAAEALANALDILNAPVGAAAPADAKVKFATETERLAAAQAALKEVKSKYWLTAQARFAGLYLARIAAERGDQAAALTALTELVSKKVSDPAVRLAMLDLVRLRIAKGEGALLAKDLEAMASGQDPRLPSDVATFELGRLWESEGKPEEAARFYRKLIENFPESAYRNEAQQKLSPAS